LVASNGDNSLAVIDTGQKRVVAQYEAGYFPYAVAISPDKTRLIYSIDGARQVGGGSPDLWGGCHDFRNSICKTGVLARFFSTLILIK
jgi:hypothetical protein